MANPAQSLSAIQAAVSDAIGRAEVTWREPEAFSVRRFEAKHGLPNGVLSKLRLGRVSYLRGDMARRVGAALGIDWQILAAREPAAPRPAGAPLTAKAILPTADHEQLIEEAYDGTRHRLADARAVDAVVAAHWALLQGSDDAVNVTRIWLDTAAAIRARGGVATVEAVTLEVTRRLAESG